MNIFTRMKSALTRRVNVASLPGGSIEFQKRWGKQPDVSQDALVQKYWGWVYSCAQLSAARLAATPLRAYVSRAPGESVTKNFRARKVNRHKAAMLKQRLGKSLDHVYGAEDFEELEEHPILELFAHVNKQENGFELRELTSVMLDLTGNAYWYVERDKLGVPSALFVLRSQWVTIHPDEKRFISHFTYGVDKMNEVEIEPEQIVHFKYPNPRDPWYGLGPVQAAAYSVEHQEAREQFITATMRNMARPDLVVKYLEGELDPKERSLLEREWNQLFRGPKSAGKVKVTDFRYEIEKLGWNPQELRFHDGEEWLMKKICAAFPVPVGLVDTTQISRAPRSGMEGSDLFMAQFNTLPRCVRMEEKINERLCPMYDERLFVAFDDPVPKDIARQQQEDQIRLTTYQTTVNEIRERDGLEPVEWGDLPLTAPGIGPLGAAPTVDKWGNPIKPEGGEEEVEEVEETTEAFEKALQEIVEKVDDSEGRWVTVGGNRILLREGQDPAEALFETISRPLGRAKIGDVGMVLHEGKIKVGNLEVSSKPGSGTYTLRLNDGSKIDVPKRDVRAPKGSRSSPEKSLEKALKQAGDGVTLEVEGQYVHPDLAGIPVRLRPTRNEHGRFDKRGVGRLHGSREAMGVFGLKERD